MAFEKKDIQAKPETELKTTVRMQYRGHFKGTRKVVSLPIPLIANSQKLEEELVFERAAGSRGPAFCDVSFAWAGTLLEVGGYWSLAEPMTPELTVRLAAAKETTDARMQRFILENELVET